MFNRNSKDGSHPGGSTLLRKVNESALLELIRDEGPITRLDLARRLHLSLPTITRIVNSLVAAGLVYESSRGDSRGGRRPTLLEFNFRSSLIISVYVGERMVGALSDLNGEVLARKDCLSRPGETGLNDLVALIENLRAEAARLNLPVRGVCIGAPAIVKFPAGVVKWAPILQWRDLPLRQRLEATLNLPVVVENEVNLIALGESWRGQGQGIPNFICISLGAGIGAGLILSGQLYRGAHYAAGEVGYLVPDASYLGRDCASYGFLEGLAGSAGIVRRLRARLEAGETSPISPVAQQNASRLDAQMIFDAARRADPLAMALVNETIDLLSIVISDLASILDPERVIFCGELADYSDLFIAPIQDRIKGLLPDAMPEMTASDLKMDAAVLGAVAMVLRTTSDAVYIQPYQP